MIRTPCACMPVWPARGQRLPMLPAEHRAPLPVELTSPTFATFPRGTRSFAANYRARRDFARAAVEPARSSACLVKAA
jgi:hypothetical protein